MLCYLRALLFKNSWYRYVILQRWGQLNISTPLGKVAPYREFPDRRAVLGRAVQELQIN